MTAARSDLMALAWRLREAAYFCTKLEDLEDHCKQVATELDRLAASQPDREVLAREAEMADGCFEAALAEGWADALANGDVERITDLFNRRIAFARNHIIAILSLLSGAGTKSDGGVESRHAETGNKSGAAPEAEQSSSATSFVRASGPEDKTSKPRAGVTPGPSDQLTKTPSADHDAGNLRGWSALFVECHRCGGSGFSSPGTGYGDVCSECGGLRFLPFEAAGKRPVPSVSGNIHREQQRNTMGVTAGETAPNSPQMEASPANEGSSLSPGGGAV